MSEPKLLSLIVADEIRQERNGKYMIIGSYLDVNLDYIPEEQPKSINVIATVIGLPEGQHNLCLHIEDVEGGHSFKTSDTGYYSRGESSLGLIIQEIDGFYFPTPGTYYFTFFVDDNELASLPISVRFPKKPTEKDSEPAKSGPKKKAGQQAPTGKKGTAKPSTKKK